MLTNISIGSQASRKPEQRSVEKIAAFVEWMANTRWPGSYGMKEMTIFPTSHSTMDSAPKRSNAYTQTYVTSNLSLSSDPAGMYASRVKGRQILLENPARESRAMKKLEEKRMRKRRDKEKKKLGIIGKREAKEKGVWKFDDAQAKFVFLIFFECVVDRVFCFVGIIRFDLFLPLHHLWMGYMSELLSLSREPSSANASAMAKAIPGSASMHPKLLKADFHGSIMTGSYHLSLLFHLCSHITHLSPPE